MAHPLAFDGALAALLAVLALATAGDYGRGDRVSPLGVVLLLASTIPLTWRRHHPLAVLVAVTLAAISYELLGEPETSNTFGVLFALYSVAANGSRRASIWSAVGVAAALVVVFTFASYEDLSWGAIVGNYVIFGTAWLVGESMRQRRERLVALAERAALAEERRIEESERAVTAERARIARELHDVVAHSVSVMVVQASAARRVLAHDPAAAAASLASVEAVGRQSLHELRRLLGVLRHDDDRAFGRVPQPSIDHLDALIEQIRGAGTEVELIVEGEAKRLAPGVDLTAYRIVQEALTNVLKHAGPARATVRLGYGDLLEIEVCDDGRGETVRRDGGGQGLPGMAERVTLFGGALLTGNRPGGGFRVRARLPLEEVTE